MAQLNGSATASLTASAAPALGAQLQAIAWLRWRVLVNGFRRKGGAGELIGRIVIFPLFAVFALLPCLAAGFFAYEWTRSSRLDHIGLVLWGAFALTQVLNINLGQPGTNFDPTELIRFPVPLARWVLIRLCFGLLSPGNILIGLLSLSTFLGIALASPRLLLPALLILFTFTLVNVLFTRMIFAWVDRWLSTRRAREIFTGFVFLLSLGIQALNARYNPGFNHGRHHRTSTSAPIWLTAALHHTAPLTHWLPPSLAATSLQSYSRGNIPAFLADVLLCAAYGGVFLAIYTLRMRTEFHGENLSDVANLARKTPARSIDVVSAPAVATDLPAQAATALTSILPPLLSKELLTLRRNTGLFYGLVAPAVMVFLFAGRLSSRHDAHWVLLVAVAYALLGVAPLGFNSLGMEGTGAQLYFMAPVPLRDVFFAKNVFGMLIALTEGMLVTLILGFVSARPSATDCLFVLLWALGTLLLSMTVGNRRSLAAPRRVNPGRTMNRAQSPLSTYISLGIMVGCLALGFGAELLSAFLDKLWIGTLLMFAFAAAAVFVYNAGLNGIAAYALEHRDTLFEELGKKI